MTIDEYEEGGQTLYEDFAKAVAGVLRAAIDEHPDLNLQNIQHRAKALESLRIKLSKAATAVGRPIDEVAKDVAGCRLIFYTNGDVHRFRNSGILHANFDIDLDRSKIHYPNNSDDGAEFFISENWVVRLNEARCALPEYRRFSGLTCEVQVQTLLDHAWAQMAHDTIYKPLTDVGFGSGAIEGMRKRLRKVMRDYLQPAGHEFEKIASDSTRLREGKSMFDQDALAVIRGCADRNCLEDEIERFASHVLPQYDDLIAHAPEIIDTLSDAAIRAITMPAMPKQTHFGEYPGARPEAIVAQVCDVLESGYIIYADLDRMFAAIIAMHKAAQNSEQHRSVDDLARRFSQHDLRAWTHGGPWVQRLIVERIAALGDANFVDAAPIATKMLGQVLSSTITGATARADTLTLHHGAVLVSNDLKAIRSDAIAQLKRLHGLAAQDDARCDIRQAMLAAGNTPNNAGYSDELGVVIMNDLTEVVRFLADTFSSLPLELKRRLEVDVFRLFHSYHALPPTMAENAELVAAQGRLLDAIRVCRNLIDGDGELLQYRLLVGHDSVSRTMWDNASYDFEATAKERSAEIALMVGTVSPATEAGWLDRLERFVETRSSDLAMFLGLHEYLKKLAHASPSILLGWLPRLSDRLAKWLPGMLHDLADAGQGKAIDALIEQWVAEDKHLADIAWYLQFAARFRFDLLVAITKKGLDAADDQILGNVALAAARQSARHTDELFEQIFLPAAKSLSERHKFRWFGGIFNWDEVGLLRALNTDQVSSLLKLMVEASQLGHDGEAMLAVIAGDHVDQVLMLIGERFKHDQKTSDARYEDFPHRLVFLGKPLAAVPSKVVAAARLWFNDDPVLAQFRGGRLIAELFPNLQHPLYPLLYDHIMDDREGVEFVLSVLQAYEGQAFLHPLLQAIVAVLGPDDELLETVRNVIESSGVLAGAYGGVEAQEARKKLVADWERDERQSVRDFAEAFTKSADNSLALERRRADQDVASRRLAWEE